MSMTAFQITVVIMGLFLTASCLSGIRVGVSMRRELGGHPCGPWDLVVFGLLSLAGPALIVWALLI